MEVRSVDQMVLARAHPAWPVVDAARQSWHPHSGGVRAFGVYCIAENLRRDVEMGMKSRDENRICVRNMTAADKWEGAGGAKELQRIWQRNALLCGHWESITSIAALNEVLSGAGASSSAINVRLVLAISPFILPVTRPHNSVQPAQESILAHHGGLLFRDECPHIIDHASQLTRKHFAVFMHCVEAEHVR